MSGDDWDDWDDDPDAYETVTAPGYFDPIEDDAVAAIPTVLDDDSTGPIVLTVSVTNAAGTVTATATFSGRLLRIDLLPESKFKDEVHLAREVTATAEMARLKGQASQRGLVQDMLVYQGADHHTARDYVDEYMNLPTSEQAAQAQADARARYFRGEY